MKEFLDLLLTSDSLTQLLVIVMGGGMIYFLRRTVKDEVRTLSDKVGAFALQISSSINSITARNKEVKGARIGSHSTPINVREVANSFSPTMLTEKGAQIAGKLNAQSLVDKQE